MGLRENINNFNLYCGQNQLDLLISVEPEKHVVPVEYYYMTLYPPGIYPTVYH